MNEVHDSIDSFKQVTLSFEAGSTPYSRDLIPHGTRFQFIFGLGHFGFSPFEFELAEKIAGDEIVLQIKRTDIQKMFQHLNPPFTHIPGDIETVYLNVKVLEVIKAGDREIIKAMAENSGCGCSCCGH